tara:strand:+ start:24 stop:233 length:210 start_codon:yes stop_codon:yes gene_type:complete
MIKKTNSMALNRKLEKKPSIDRDQKKATRLSKKEAQIKIDHPIKYGVISVAMALPYLRSILDPLDNHVL